MIRLINIGEAEFNVGGISEKVNAMGVNIKGIHTLEHYLMARYFSYSQVTMHRTTSAFESLAKTIIWFLAENGRIYTDYDSIKKIVGKKEFLAFDDSYLWNRIGNKSLFIDSTYATYRDALIERKRIKILYEIKEIRNKQYCPDPRTNYSKLKSAVETNLKLFASKLGIPIERIGYLEQKMSVDKSLDEIFKDEIDQKEAPRVFINNRTSLLVDQQACLIKEMFDKELHILRVFYIDPWPYDRDKSNELHKSAKESIGCELNFN
ncbi:hypothetical protein N752_25120 [Desulforamulus aquiferis]|nr:hypothetical protein [Desulforamulus aquiferis]RYD02612.1 hypothetical protein N752_25120 [Desulforamulus aquiferis]